MMELRELNASIDAWAVKNGLDKLKESDQKLKIIEEIGELARAILKKDIDGQKDAIGDIYIALRVYMSQTGGIFEDEYVWYYVTIVPIRPSYTIEQLCSKVQNLQEGDDFFKELQYNAQYLELDFTECVEQAFNEVKDRDLKIVDGVAVKQSQQSYLVQDVDNDEYFECSIQKEVNEIITNIKDDLHEGYDGRIPLGSKIKTYKLIETTEFVADTEATADGGIVTGVWQTKKEKLANSVAVKEDLEKELEAYRSEYDVY